MRVNGSPAPLSVWKLRPLHNVSSITKSMVTFSGLLYPPPHAALIENLCSLSMLLSTVMSLPSTNVRSAY